MMPTVKTRFYALTYEDKFLSNESGPGVFNYVIT
jgi:hypothetical protein